MTTETKRDVFEDIVDTLHVMDGAPDDYCKKLLDRYGTALPDSLPVIPKVVGEWIILCKGHAGTEAGINNILDALTLADFEPEYWINDNSEVFARAWVLGVWRVEETGEVVKL